MATVLDEFHAQHEKKGLAGAWSALIAEDADTTSDKLTVIIPALNNEYRWGPCRWQSRDEISLPVRGDRALVLFDETSTPWIVMWWPFDENTLD